jgi:hypothetical protein
VVASAPAAEAQDPALLPLLTPRGGLRRPAAGAAPSLTLPPAAVGDVPLVSPRKAVKFMNKETDSLLKKQVKPVTDYEQVRVCLLSPHPPHFLLSFTSCYVCVFKLHSAPCVWPALQCWTL